MTMRTGIKSTVVLWLAPLVLASLVCFFGTGCKSSVKPAALSSQIDAATAGTVEGAIQFTGNAPERVAIDMRQDPNCVVSGQPPNMSEVYVVNDGKMANVFVYIKDGLGNRIYAAPSNPAVLDQKGCRYVPHAIGVMAGQPVEFRTSDPAMHNINLQPKAAGNPPLNTSQAPFGTPVRHVFVQPEMMIPVRCNLHPWMEAYINVVANPFYAVSDAEGRYTIRGLPPGTYTLVAEQEKLGAKEQSITVAAHQTTQANFTFNTTPSS
jgi:plastocyanin